MRNFEQPTRSVVVAREAMAATSHPTATLTAVEIMRAGGNAMDAAIAACAVQCVVEPASTGIGGDCFALLSRAGSSQVTAFNGSGRTPSALSLDWFESRGMTEIGQNSAAAVTVPGAIDAWTTLHADHGSLPFEELLAPAIRLAEEGYAISPRVHFDWAKEVGLLSRDETARRIFLPDNRAPEIGEVHRQPELAATLRLIAKGGRAAFYEGPVAEDIVEYLTGLGGVHTLSDFAEARGEYVTPISAPFRDTEIYECPPNGQGVIALLILNILARFGADADPQSPDRLHIEIEAARLAYAARDVLLADPEHATVPVEEMLSDGWADRLSGMIDLKAARKDLPAFSMPRHPDTVYISVVDKDRNAVSFINSLFESFGSGLVSPRTGVTLHNRGQSFSLSRNHPNAVAPRKRPLHTLIPGMLLRGGRTEMPFGVMGGHYQAMGHAHLISKVVDYGMDLQEAINLPRVIPVSGTLKVQAEQTLPDTTVKELERRGFTVIPAVEPIGGAQAIQIDWKNGTLIGASEPRKDGCALGI
jgi:gamma-glutamyltranspeptidase / glutathione hydrolase